MVALRYVLADAVVAEAVVVALVVLVLVLVDALARAKADVVDAVGHVRAVAKIHALVVAVAVEAVLEHAPAAVAVHVMTLAMAVALVGAGHAIILVLADVN